MRNFKWLVASSALLLSTNAQAANFFAYTFTGIGYGYISSLNRSTGVETNTFIPKGEFSTTFYVDIDPTNGSVDNLYYSNGIDAFSRYDNLYRYPSYVSLADNGLKASNATPLLYGSVTSIVAKFEGPLSQFSDLSNGARVLGGSFSYKDAVKDYSAGAAGTITGFSVKAVDHLGQISTTFTAVPEASTWAMMLAGFAMIGFATRRRRSVTTTVRFA